MKAYLGQVYTHYNIIGVVTEHIKHICGYEFLGILVYEKGIFTYQTYCPVEECTLTYNKEVSDTYKKMFLDKY